MISPQTHLSHATRTGNRRSTPSSTRGGVVSLQRNSLTRFLLAESPPPNESSAELENVTNCSSDRSLAKGILRQTARDLRRFSGAHTRGQHDLYDDAYTWLWPTICVAMFVPEYLRHAWAAARANPRRLHQSRNRDVVFPRAHGRAQRFKFVRFLKFKLTESVNETSLIRFR